MIQDLVSNHRIGNLELSRQFIQFFLVDHATWDVRAN